MLDPQYVVARGVLLDALQALGAQRDAVVVVGAQAIYLHTGAIELAVAEYTTDADITIDPALLHESPEIESAMRAALFERGNRLGAWIVYRDIAGVPTKVEVDLMVPEAVGGSGRRAARLPGHGKEVARKARGLEAALVDKATTTIHALDAADARSFAVPVAGPAALLVAKLHKIAERVAEREQRRLGPDSFLGSLVNATVRHKGRRSVMIRDADALYAAVMMNPYLRRYFHSLLYYVTSISRLWRDQRLNRGSGGESQVQSEHLRRSESRLV